MQVQVLEARQGSLGSENYWSWSHLHGSSPWFACLQTLSCGFCSGEIWNTTAVVDECVHICFYEMYVMDFLFCVCASLGNADIQSTEAYICLPSLASSILSGQERRWRVAPQRIPKPGGRDYTKDFVNMRITWTPPSGYTQTSPQAVLAVLGLKGVGRRKLLTTCMETERVVLQEMHHWNPFPPWKC